jgi:CheY-like chemotaxis protein
MSAKKILIIDDNLVILKTLQNKLELNGYKVLTAQDGGEAISLARNEQPDIILVDLSFPPDVAHGGGVPWDGFLIMSWLRRSEDPARRKPFIVITGSDQKEFRQRALAMGVAHVFQKPIDNDNLLTVIREILDREAADKLLASAQAS